MLSKKDRARIARENGAKSKGPVTPEGKEKCSRNALKSGEYASKLELFLPAHPVVLCNEDRNKFNELLHVLTGIYQPINEAAFAIVKSIAIARWEAARLHACVTSHWNLALVEAAAKPSTLAPELVEVQAMVRASTELFSGNAVLVRLHRQIDQFENAIAKLERRLKFLHANFPNNPVEQTQPVPQPVENTAEEPPIIVTENTPAVIAAYKKLYPNRKIIVLPADDVAKGIEIEDHMPIAPRKAA